MIMPTNLIRASQSLSLVQSYRLLGSSVRRYHELSFLERGDPLDVLEYHKAEGPPDPPADDAAEYVRVQMIHSPWNPADKNTVQGKYPSPLKNTAVPQPPSVRGAGWKVAGSEGLGVIESGNDAGTWVTFGQSGMGTLRSSFWVPKRVVIPIERARGMELQDKTGGAAASTLFQLGGTAWRMLNDFESLSENSIVLQNAGNSGVGWMVSQLAAERNIRVVSLVRRGSRSRQDFDRLVETLTQQSTNTTQVVAEEDLLDDKDAQKQFQSELGGHPRLALNAVGGPSASLLLKMLAPGGTMVTYGGLSMQPVTLATPQLIFKDVKCVGYWHSRWMVRAFPQVRKRMVADLLSAVLDGNVTCPPVKVFPLHQVQEALRFEAAQSSGAVRKKIVFDCREEEGQ